MPRRKYSKEVLAAIRAAGLKFNPSDEHVDTALKEYGAWHLPTLKIEAEDIKQKLLAIEERAGEGVGVTWGFYHSMIIAIAVREFEAKKETR